MKNQEKRMINQDGIVTIEELPYPYVYYPGFLGTFIGFKNDKKRVINLCSCSKQAILNYLEFRNLGSNSQAIPSRNFILDSQDFPIQLVNKRMNKSYINKTIVFDTLNFENNLCHECNKIKPKILFSTDIGSFKENYGWYINKQAYEYGVIPYLTMRKFEYKEHLIPNDIRKTIEITKNEYNLKNIEISKRYNNNWQDIIKDEERINLYERYNDQIIRINKIIENTVRLKFGFEKIGDQWTSETILYYLIEEIFPGKKIYRNYRPYWLNRMEMDIYIEDLKLAIEYQGIQHYYPIEHWGGDEGLKKVQERDRKKKEILDKKGIKLFYVRYDEELSKSDLKKKLKHYLT